MPFISHLDARWGMLLGESVHDLYHLASFSAIEAELLEGEAVGWYHETGSEKYLIPLIKREIGHEGRFDLVSPYGYPGMLFNTQAGQADHKKVMAVFRHFDSDARQAGYVSSFIRLNPLWNPWTFADGEMLDTGRLRQWFHGGTISVDLQASESVLKQSFSENHRRNLKRLAHLGFVAKLNQWDHVSDFIAAYRQTMRRRMAHPYYFFPDAYFQRLRQVLADQLIFVSVIDASGNFCSGGLFTLFDKVMQYHLGATTSEKLYLSPSKLMMDAAISYGITHGAELLHLGGGLGGSISDGLFRFKKGFGRQYHPYSTLRFIHDPQSYEQLKKAGKFAKKAADYFPEYR